MQHTEHQTIDKDIIYSEANGQAFMSMKLWI